MDLHILNIQMKPWWRKVKKKKNNGCAEWKKGGKPFLDKHDEAEGGRMGEQEKQPWTKPWNPMLEQLKDEFAKRWETSEMDLKV